MSNDFKMNNDMSLSSLRNVIVMEKGFVSCENLVFGRISFKGFNPEIEVMFYPFFLLSFVPLVCKVFVSVHILEPAYCIHVIILAVENPSCFFYQSHCGNNIHASKEARAVNWRLKGHVMTEI